MEIYLSIQSSYPWNLIDLLLSELLLINTYMYIIENIFWYNARFHVILHRYCILECLEFFHIQHEFFLIEEKMREKKE